MISCLNFWDEAWWFLSVRVFVLLSSLKMISQAESFLCPDKQGTPEESGWIQWPKRGGNNNTDEDNSPKTLTDKKYKYDFMDYTY